ncbi:MAG: DUF6089 family protein [Bacteroidales bacterium]|nr:DUF6089 family protein [Bacteroidales bacterium]
MGRSFFARMVLGLSMCVSLGAYAQEMEVGGLAGGTYYLGELNPGRQFLFTRPAFGGLVKVNLDDRWSVRLQFLQGKIAGDDAVSLANEARNLRFRSSISEISIIGEFNFLPFFVGSKINYFSPYLFVGPAYFSFNPKAPYDGSYVELRGLGTEGTIDNYKLYGVAAVFGFGIKYSLTERIGLGLEWGMRKTYTDYLDDISENYYLDFSTIDINDIGASEYLSDSSATKHSPGMQRGNPQNNDWYSFAGITLSYRFKLGEKTTCRDFENSNN